MPKKVKKFIDKKNAVTYALMARPGDEVLEPRLDWVVAEHPLRCRAAVYVCTHACMYVMHACMHACMPNRQTLNLRPTPYALRPTPYTLCSKP